MANDEAQESGTRYFLLAFRQVGDAFEQATLSAAEIPLNVLSTIGVPASATDAARAGGKQVVEGIHGTVDAVATGIADAVGTSAHAVSEVITSATKAGSSK